MSLNPLDLGLPQPVGVAVTTLVGLLVAYALARLLRRFFRWLAAQDEVPRVAREVICLAAQSALAAVLRHSPDLAGQEAAVREAALEVYRQLPDAILIPIRGRAVPIPIKLIVSQAAFVELTLGLYRGAERLEEQIEQALRDEYAYWQEMGRPGLVPARG